MDRSRDSVDISTITTRCIVTITILTGALAISGNWLVFYVNAVLYSYDVRYNYSSGYGKKSTPIDDIPQSTTVFKWHQCFDDLRTYWISTNVVAFLSYFLFGITFHWYFYVKQRDKPKLWKCQPERWLSKESEIDAIKLGCLTLFVSSTWTSLLSTYLSNGGYSTLYYKWDEYGVLWFIVQIPILFFGMDYMTYWWHRSFHIPFLYNRFHKFHHKYVQPTAFSLTAVHPFEMTVQEFLIILPIFTIPTYWVIYHMIIVYFFYHGILGHSGINFKAHWWQPWQSHSIFHDNHHQYYHVNFGFNVEWWDKVCTLTEIIYTALVTIIIIVIVISCIKPIDGQTRRTIDRCGSHCMKWVLNNNRKLKLRNDEQNQERLSITAIILTSRTFLVLTIVNILLKMGLLTLGSMFVS